MRGSLVVAAAFASIALGLGGCYSPTIGDGDLICSDPAKQCPKGFHCATDNTCWRDGRDPDAGVSPPEDLLGADLFGADLTALPDFRVVDLSAADLHVVKVGIGMPCGSDNDCLSSFCADGVCCQTRCDEACTTCNGPNTAGSCVALAQGLAPLPGHAGCAPTAMSVCGNDGKCDGKGVCQLWSNVECKPSKCDITANTAHAASKCDGKGMCIDAPELACLPFVCKTDLSACHTTCVTAAECKAPNLCISGSCGKKGNGATCAAASECLSNNCIDGFCCDLACGGQCEACDVGGKQGTCSQVAGIPHGGRTACTGTGICGGTCSTSQSMCTYPTVSCRVQSCAGAIKTAAATCNGMGACPAPSTSSCGTGYVCNSTATDCNASCTSDPQCASGFYCQSPNCTPKLANGAACTAAGQCASNICTDGRCCDATCGGQCQACNVPNLLGTCSQVTGAPHGTRTACAGSGTCVGSCSTSPTACTFPTGSCRAASCSGGILTNAASCDVSHNCPASTTTSCSPYICASSTTCRTTCSTNADCVSGLFCNGNVCLTTRPNGQPCTSASQCTSMQCWTGFCCNATCSGGCQTCASPAGSCTNLPVGTTGTGCGLYLCQGNSGCPTTCSSGNQCCSGICNTSPAGCSSVTCFVAGTLVDSERGLRAIETIGPGDRVRSYDTATGKTEYREVVQLERRIAPSVVSVMIEGEAPIDVSPEHYFWVLGSGWVRAQDLSFDDKLLAPDGNTRAVAALQTVASTGQAGVPVFNLVVEGLHDYYVGTGKVLVHSCDYLGFSSLPPANLPR